MNKVALLRVADMIAAGSDVAFCMDMTLDRNDCGTSACVAGFALIDKCGSFNAAYRSGVWEAQKHLGLTETQKLELFYSPTVPFDEINLNAQHVPAALRWMVENNTISWLDASNNVEGWVRVRTLS